MRVRSAFFALVVVVLGTAHPAAGQARLQSTLDTTLVTVGDRMVLTVQVEHPSGATVVWPDSLDLSPFEALAASVEPTRSEGDRVVSTARFEIAAFQLGELELPSFAVEVLYPDGRTESLETDRFGVEVTSVGVDEGEDIREIRGPFFIPISTITIALWALLLLALLVGAVLGYRRWARRDAPEVVEPTAPPRPAHEVALEALRDIERSNMLQRGQVKEYHIAVSEVLRRYVGERYQVHALEMTTWEIVGGLERVGVGSDFRSGLRSVLDACDLVKFAKVRPDPARAAGVVADAIALVEASVAWLPASEADTSDADASDAASPAASAGEVA